MVYVMPFIQSVFPRGIDNHVSATTTVDQMSNHGTEQVNVCILERCLIPMLETTINKKGLAAAWINSFNVDSKQKRIVAIVDDGRDRKTLEERRRRECDREYMLPVEYICMANTLGINLPPKKINAEIQLRSDFVYEFMRRMGQCVDEDMKRYSFEEIVKEIETLSPTFEKNQNDVSQTMMPSSRRSVMKTIFYSVIGTASVIGIGYLIYNWTRQPDLPTINVDTVILPLEVPAVIVPPTGIPLSEYCRWNGIICDTSCSDPLLYPLTFGTI
jgi:hypothetical protein